MAMGGVLLAGSCGSIRLWVERAIRAFREQGPMRRAHWGLARWAGRAREGRHR